MTVNALTIDVEDYFHVHAFSSAIKQNHWESFVPRVRKNTLLILDMIDRCNKLRQELSGENRTKSSATFFVLAWVAERFPDLVREIVARGHEVACHGYGHKCIFNQTRKEFEEDVRRAKAILEDIAGKPVIGYRAPTYSIRKETLWSIEVLISQGFRYDSSIFPVRHDIYGMPEAPRFPFFLYANGNGVRFVEVEEARLERNKTNGVKKLLEFPLTTTRALGVNIPIAGGGYFRLLPYGLTKALLKRVNEREKKPFIFYIHPWEMDKKTPRMNGGNLFANVRTYINLEKTEARLRKLLSAFRFSSLSELLEKDLAIKV
jgi:polysaccharide deacetylase family protein (PEP-CTERM system associated)